jgi:hypothetical protein
MKYTLRLHLFLQRVDYNILFDPETIVCHAQIKGEGRCLLV